MFTKTVRNRIARIVGYSSLLLCLLGIFLGTNAVLVIGIWGCAFALCIVSPIPMGSDAREIGEEQKISFANAIAVKVVWGSMLRKYGVYIVCLAIGTFALLRWGVPWIGILGIYATAFLSFFKSDIVEVERSQVST
ncbi:hypothetical protein HW561_13475 [Rhodobacteraceae bacterium B1Z28]|uniref:ATP synthase I subunit n=1 Tax=Ruegeria haliotis TaxID=2747601 RepID=A0ABX2PRM4_9RHOB|nr:hypothetical protein [Ruegeria haliotis]NVO56798.1 hypothetical protein [Ruegeria haliotis]